MRSKLLVIWAIVLMSAIGAVVQGRVAVQIEESEARPFAKILSETTSPGKSPSEMAQFRAEAKRLYREGKCVAAEDLYRLARVLSNSKNAQDLLLAHDCALASLIEGFRPSVNALRTSQKQLLRSIGYGDSKQRIGLKVARDAAATPLLKQFEASWSAAVKSIPQSRTGFIALAVVV